MSRERGNTILVGLKLTSLDGKVERDIICTTAITVFNLHKVIQWSLFPSKGDDTVAATVGGHVPKQSSLPSLHPIREHLIRNLNQRNKGAMLAFQANHPQSRAGTVDFSSRHACHAQLCLQAPTARTEPAQLLH